MGAIDVIFYHFKGDNRQISKTLLDGIPFYGVQYRGDIDFHNPVFPIEQTIDDSYNYCGITFHGETPAEDITKYYFCRIVNTRENLSTAFCDIDVLMTYKNAILQLPVWCKRSAVLQTPYIPDNRAPVETRRFVAGNPADAIGAHSADMVLFTVG